MYTSAEIILLANNARVDNGFPVLSINSKLGLAAAAAAKDMFSKQYFAHFSPGGVSPWTWIRNTGYKYSAVGENLAIDFIDAGDIVASWLDSPTHRKILLGSYNDTGVAVLGGTMNDLPAVIVVQFFGSPAVAKASAPVVEAQKEERVAAPATAEILPAVLPAVVPIVEVPEAPVKVTVLVALPPDKPADVVIAQAIPPAGNLPIVIKEIKVIRDAPQQIPAIQVPSNFGPTLLLLTIPFFIILFYLKKKVLRTR